MISRVGTIKGAVANSFGIPVGEFVSRRKTRPYALARFAAFRLCRDLTPLSLPEIGRAFDRDHATILHGIKRAGALLARDPEFRSRYATARTAAESGLPAPVEVDPVFEHLHRVFCEIAEINGFVVNLEKREVGHETLS